MDDIQRKLALIDKQLAWGAANIHKQIISTSPLLFVVIGLIAGIFVQSALTISIGFWQILLVLCILAVVVSYLASRISYLVKEKNLPYIIAYIALLCFLCLGAIRLITFNQPKPNDIRNLVGNERKLATIRGVIITKPYIQKNEQWQFARFKYTDPTSSFYLKMEEIKTVAESPLWRNGWAKVSGTIRVRVDEPVLDLEMGDYIQAYCWLDRFQKATNPGQFDIAKYLARKNIFVGVSVKSRDGIELLEGSQTGIFKR